MLLARMPVCRLLVGLSTLVGAGCQQNRPAASSPTALFALPVIAPPKRQTPVPALIAAERIRGVNPPFVGRFPFASRIALEHPDRVGPEEHLTDFARYRVLEDSSTLGTDGLEIAADYGQSVVYQKPGNFGPYAHLFPPRRTFPVYVANTSRHRKLLYGKDRWVFAIQEAKDRNGQWRPIESKGPDFCGNGRWVLKLRPGQMGVFLMDKYSGAYQTLLRVRLQNGDSRYVSAPYKGQIDERQFALSATERQRLEESDGAIQQLYFGAAPALADSIAYR
ncbi:hypothetical protein [Hymenobacter arizonensis]|uniref:Lipoprotein n=1 Tax=Hymenobacter arizonensis TaxID=1227077 RepID=A0A1I6BR63_HYMAR|nr:hypothetical protein [Hymenobacter arizonensis]SFQ83354.1 hypothetical protein SAMN04515668_4952 [Hymenobacter arizonensis]